MAGAGFGIDATRCRPALDPADCRRGPNIEKPRRLSRALARLHDRQYPDPKVLGVVCPACSIAGECESPVQPDGGEGLAKHKGVIVRWRLKEVWSKAAA